MRALAAAGALCLIAGTAYAQQPAAPFRINPDAPFSRPQLPAADAGAAAARPAADASPTRPLVPFGALRFLGETDQRGWAFDLTDAEAGRAASLALSYRNSIVVMPEVSRLRVSINGTEILAQPIASSSDFSRVEAQIPAGVLRAGPNTIRFHAMQFHRIDCSPRGTYELWTEIDPAMTGLVFAGGVERQLRVLDDLPSVGVDRQGQTIIRVIAPDSRERGLAPALLELAQAIALRGRFTHPIFRVSDGGEGIDPAGPGEINLVIGPSAQLGGVVSALPADAGARATAGFVTDGRLGPSTLVVTGPDWNAVKTATAAIADSVTRPTGVSRTAITTSSWHAPDVPNFARARSVTLADMEVRTQEFAGRLFRTRFMAGLPADFYASSYGQATLYLDAAYTAEVRPGSHIDIYVNGRIASTLTMTDSSGGIYRRLPVSIPLTNFRPGVNEVTIEAVLETTGDAECAPGATIPGASRFVLFDTTELAFPTFARAARLPDLAGLSGTGFPYARSLEPVALFLGRHDPETYSAAATMMARVALDAGRPINLDFSRTPAAASSMPAIFIGAAQQFTPDVLTGVSLADTVATAWRDPQLAVLQGPQTARGDLDALVADYRRRQGSQTGDASAPDAATGEVFERWREDLSDGGGWRGQVSAFDDWMQRTFDISLSSLRIGGQTEQPYMPGPNAGLIVAQQRHVRGEGIWTVIAAPNSASLAASAETAARRDIWWQMTGRVAAYEPQTARFVSQAATEVEIVLTQPFSLANSRLIAANWLSSNIAFYALILVGACLFLGIYTHRLLSRLGRRS